MLVQVQYFNCHPDLTNGNSIYRGIKIINHKQYGQKIKENKNKIFKTNSRGNIGVNFANILENQETHRKIRKQLSMYTRLDSYEYER